MKKEDIKFLKELQHEMLTQDTVGQADPRFWVVMQKVRKYGIDIDYHEYDGEVLIEYDGEVIAENLDELYEFVKEREKGNDFVICKVGDYLKITKTIYNIDYYIYTLTDFYDMMDEINFDCIHVAYYKEEYKIVEDTMFLTLKECERHIKNNSYHYKDPVPYAMTAWRSPQVDKLYKILQNTDWDELEG